MHQQPPDPIHAPDCVSMLDDESDYEYLDDAGTCTCGAVLSSRPEEVHRMERTIDVDPIFTVHRLNEEGLTQAREVALQFDGLLANLVKIIGNTNTREWSLVKTKLEEACFFAKKNLANDPRYQVARGAGT